MSKTRPADCAICRFCAGFRSWARAMRICRARRSACCSRFAVFCTISAGRDDNKLSFERQDEIAELIGAASPEALMRQYYRAVRDIARLANRRLERFESKRSSLFSQFRDRTAKLLELRFFRAARIGVSARRRRRLEATRD